MPKLATKFSAALQREYPFLKLVAGSQSSVVCTLCLGKFSVANSGRSQITQHFETKKHIRACGRSSGNQPRSTSPRKALNELQSFQAQTSGSTVTEMDESIDLQAQDLIHNCRFCLKPFKDSRKSLEITGTIEQRFFELTQSQLVQDERLSRVICIPCENDLGVFTNYRDNLFENQKILLDACMQKDRVDVKEEFDTIIIKAEAAEECRPEEIYFDEVPTVVVQASSKKSFRGPYKKKNEPELDNDDEQLLYEEIKALRRTSKEARVKCPRCHKSMHKNSLKEHFFGAHARRKRFKCEICDEEFLRGVAFSQHLETRHGKKQKSSGRASRKVHKEIMPEQHPWIKDETQRLLFNKIETLLKSVEGSRVQCPECSKSMHKNSLKEHFFTLHSPESRFQCDLCGFEFYRRSRLLLHLKSQHLRDQHAMKVESTIKVKTSCEECGAMVYDQRRHSLKVHLAIKNFYCDLCPYGAFFKYDLEKHMHRHYQKNREKFYCEVCGLQFEQRGILNTHIKKKHTVRERTHQCTVCQKFFHTKKILERHAEYHAERNIPCEFCGKLFTCKNNLRSHLYLHQEPRHICDFPGCDKKFHMKRLLRFHLKSHRGERDYECDQCNKGFYSQSDLNRHTFAIHEKLRFFCILSGCTGSFSRREYYKKHVVEVHQSLEIEDIERLLEDVKTAVPSQKS